MISVLKTLANNESSGSLAHRLRIKRFALFLELINSLPHPVKILDVGGTGIFWERMGFLPGKAAEITLFNINEPQCNCRNFISITGDATNMKQFSDQEFDIAFSNSVIEHVGDFARQSQMADELKRVGKRIFLQTPNRYFPVEPHFLFPLFQFFPLKVKVWLVMHFKMGWYNKISEREKAVDLCNSIRLLSRVDLLKMFPGAMIRKEKFFGLTKSFLVFNECYL
jgi:hypothetical protein